MKIVTYNVQWFKGLDNVVDIARVLNVARELADFDALCLQEVAVNYLNLTVKSRLPVLFPLQSTFTCVVLRAKATAGSVIVALVVAVHPFESVTVTE